MICGANDVLLSVRPDVGGYAATLALMLSRLEGKLPEAALVTATIPDLSLHMPLRPRTRERVTRGMRQLNEATRSVARRHGVLCLEFADHPAAGDRANYAGDGFHPSPEGNRRAARALMRGARAPLRHRDGPARAVARTVTSAAALFSQPFDLLREGDAFATRGRTITEADVVAFAALTGDCHPQHTDAVWAAAAPFGERIAHGMLVLSYAVGLVPFDPDRVVALRGVGRRRVQAPGALGDTIHVGRPDRHAATRGRRARAGRVRAGGCSTSTAGSRSRVVGRGVWRAATPRRAPRPRRGPVVAGSAL